MIAPAGIPEGVDAQFAKIYPSIASASGEARMAGGPEHKREPEVVLTGPWGWLARRLGIQPWGQILLLVLVALFVGGYLKFSTVEQHLVQIDTELKVLPLQLSKDLLSQAQVDLKLNKTSRAIRATETAAALIARASERRIRVAPEYFGATLEALKGLNSVSINPELSEKISMARTLLADYRSSLESAPLLPKERQFINSSYAVSYQEKVDRSTFPGSVIISRLPPGQDTLVTNFVRRLADNIYLSNLTFEGGSQTLDGFHWEDVVFLNVHIKYEGGEVDLKNVRFVNCTFEIVNSPRGAQVAEYAALNLPSLVIRAPGG